MNIWNRRYGTVIPCITPLMTVGLMLLLYSVCSVTLTAQPTTGGDNGRVVDRRDRFEESIRPVLVDVDFQGNEGMGEERLKAQISTRPTSSPWAKRLFGTFITPYELNPFTPDNVRERVRRVVDSLAGEIRYLNLNTAAEDTVTLRQFYIDHGYHDAAVRFQVHLDTTRNTAKVTFIVNEGKQYPLKGLTFVGISGVPENIRAEIEKPERLTLGEGYSKDELTAERDRVIELLRNNGYAFAESAPPTVFQIRKPYTAWNPADSTYGDPYDSALVPIYPGTRYRFGQTVRVRHSEDAPPFVDEDVVMRQRDYAEGDWYSKRKVDQTIANLYALGTFAQVRMDTASNLSHGDTLGMRIQTRLRSPREFRAGFEVGFERVVNDWRITLGFLPSFTHANLFGGGEHLSLNTYIRSRLQAITELQAGVGLSLYFPSFAPLSNRWSMLVSPSFDYAVEDRLEANVNAPSGSLLGEDVNLRSLRFNLALEGTYRFPSYTFLSYLITRLSSQWLEYSNVGDYITRRALDRIQSQEQTNGIGAFQNELTDIVVTSLKRNLYRLQVLQGDDPSLVSERDSALQATALEDFDRLKLSSVLAISGIADKRNDLFYPTKGQFVQAGLDGGVTGLPFDPNGGYIKGNFDYRLFLPWTDRKTLAFRGHIGGIVPLGRFPLVPVTARFTAGGANSIRGWGPREMLVTTAKVDPELVSTVPESVQSVAATMLSDILEESKRLLGGLFVIELSAEMRARLFNLPNTGTLNRQLNQLGINFFLDVGNAYFRSLDDDASLVTFGGVVENLGVATGFSISYDTPVGPVRFGYGYQVYDPLEYKGGDRWFWNRAPRIADGAFQFGIGYAF